MVQKNCERVQGGKYQIVCQGKHGTKVVMPTRTSGGKFDQRFIDIAILNIGLNAREEDIEEWNSWPVNKLLGLIDILKIACNHAKTLRIVLDKDDTPVAIIGVAARGKYLWSIWAKPSTAVVRDTVKHFPEIIDHIRLAIGATPGEMTNYILNRNTFFTGLLERAGAVITDASADYSPGYSRFEV